MHTKIFSKGVRIFDVDQNGFYLFKFSDLLKEIKNGASYYWSILYLEATGNLGENININDFEENILNLEAGLVIDWIELNRLANKFDEIYWINLIASKRKNNLHRYKTNKERYETCDIVIEMVDGEFWEIFTKDQLFYDNLISKFMIEKYLETDFQEKPKQFR